MRNEWNGYEDLGAFLKYLKDKDDLITIDHEVDPRLEIGQVLKVLGDLQGPAALFTNVRRFPGRRIVGNVLGHRRRVAEALGTDEANLTSAFIDRVTQRILPVLVEDGQVKEVVIKGSRIDLTELLPALTHHEKDATPYLTCAVTFARDPETGSQSMGLHRIQILSESTMTICLASPPLADFLNRAIAMGRDLEVAVALGTDPGTLIASVVWCPAGVDKIEVAGALNQQAVKMTRGETVDVTVPSQAQYVIEGVIHPHELANEAGFGETSGVYVRDVMSPVIHVTAFSHRDEPLFQGLQTWSAEDHELLDLCFGSKMLQDVRQIFPFVLDICLARGTCASQANVRVAPTTDAQIRAAMCYILCANPFIKSVVVVDEDIDLRNPEEIQWALATRFQADRDLVVLPNLQGSVIDPSAGPSATTCKTGLNATYPEEKKAEFERIDVPREVKERALKLVAEYFS